MATGTYMINPAPQFFDNSGLVLTSGTLTFYVAGTSTLLDTYSDVSLLVANPNPLTLNSAGRPAVSGTEVAIFFSAASYKVVCKNAAGSTLWTRDNLAAVPLLNVDVAITGTLGETVAANEGVYLSDGSAGLTPGRWYKWDGDLTYASTHAGALGLVPSGGASGASVTIRKFGRITGLSGLVAGTRYFASGTAGAFTSTAPAQPRYVGIAESTTVLVFEPADQTLGHQARCDGRLTLTTAVPVTTADVTAATTVRFTPYQGNQIALYNNLIWQLVTFSEVSIAVPATTNTIYDVFVSLDSGVVALEVYPWNNDTSRQLELALTDGVLRKNGDATKRYLGSFRTTGASGQTEDSFAKRYLWNYYHRVERLLRALESGNSWSGTGVGTWRQFNGNAANQLDCVIGVAEVAINIQAFGFAANDAGGAGNLGIGIGEDSTSAIASGMIGGTFTSPDITTGGEFLFAQAMLRKYPAVGRHYYPMLENGAANATFFGDGNAPLYTQSGIHGSLWG